MTHEDTVRRKVPEIKPSQKSRKSEAKKVKKESIPKAFIDHIRKLGFRDSDAEVLYENKEDWMGISTGWLTFVALFVQLVEVDNFNL